MTQGLQLKVGLLSVKAFEILPNMSKDDILVRAEDQGNSLFAHAHVADPNRLWPSGIVEYKFWKTFPPGNLPFREALETPYFSDMNISHRAASLDEEGDGLLHRHVPLRHPCPC